MSDKRTEINRVYNEFLNSKKHLVDCMNLVRNWEHEGFNSFEDALNFFLDTPDTYIEVIGVRHPIRGLNGLVALLLYFCTVEEVEGVTFVDCETFIRNLFVRAPQTANRTETEGLDFLRKSMGFQDTRFANEEEHDKFKVDIVIPGVMGVQVKPVSYKLKFEKEPEHISFKRDLAGWARWVRKTGLPVFGLFYRGTDPFIDYELEELKR